MSEKPRVSSLQRRPARWRGTHAICAHGLGPAGEVTIAHSRFTYRCGSRDVERRSRRRRRRAADRLRLHDAAAPSQCAVDAPSSAGSHRGSARRHGSTGSSRARCTTARRCRKKSCSKISPKPYASDADVRAWHCCPGIGQIRPSLPVKLVARQCYAQLLEWASPPTKRRRQSASLRALLCWPVR